MRLLGGGDVDAQIFASCTAGVGWGGVGRCGWGCNVVGVRRGGCENDPSSPPPSPHRPRQLLSPDTLICARPRTYTPHLLVMMKLTGGDLLTSQIYSTPRPSLLTSPATHSNDASYSYYTIYFYHSEWAGCIKRMQGKCTGKPVIEWGPLCYVKSPGWLGNDDDRWDYSMYPHSFN